MSKVDKSRKRRAKTGGRQKGVRNKKTAALLKAVEASGITPLDYLLERLRDPKEDPKVRLMCAKEAAPYIHPRLASVEHSGGLDVGIRELSDEDLDREIRQATAEAAPLSSSEAARISAAGTSR